MLAAGNIVNLTDAAADRVGAGEEDEPYADDDDEWAEEDEE